MAEDRHVFSEAQQLLKYPLPIGGKTVFLLRHGSIQSESAPKRFIGQTDHPLTGRGRQQARFWKSWLAKETLAGICCSDLGRCTETANIIGGVDAPPIEAIPALREIDLGQWDGLTFFRVRRCWPNAFRKRGKDIAGFRPPDGESFSDLHRRVIPAFEEMLNRTEGNLLIVAHAGVNRVILCHLLGMPLGHLFRISQNPGSMNVIERRPDGYRVHLINHPPHF